MINIYQDTLIFGKQKFGGVSAVWNEYIKRMLEDNEIDLTLLDIKKYINFEFKKMDFSNVNHINEKNKNIQLLRLMSPKIPDKKNIGIFQSTYLRICKNKNIKNVVMIHDTTHQLYFSGYKKFINNIQKRYVLKKADGIICVSENTKKDILRLFPECKNKKIEVVYNAASDEYKRMETIIIPNRYKQLENIKYFMYVGDRTDYKNIEFLYRILEKTEDLYCVLIGGKEFSKKELDRIKNIKEKIIRYTKVPNNELNILYNKAFCLIYPSLYEGFGIPILEAMKAGCPVIAFDNSSIPEVLRGSGYLLENNDIDGCLKALNELNNKENRIKIVEKQLLESEFFSWDNSYQKLKKFYKKILLE